MKVADLLELVRIERPTLPTTQSRLERCYTIDDVERLAHRRLPAPVAGYIGGGAEEEVSLASARAAWRSWSFTPRSLVDVSDTTTASTLLGREVAFPVGLAPTGYTRMIDPDGEIAVAAAAAAAGVPYALSTMGSTSLAELRGSAPAADLWFQLYVWRSRDIVEKMLADAAAHGYQVLEVAVDTAVPAARVRDLRSGLTIPPAFTAGTLAKIAARPRYWGRMLTSAPLRFANAPEGAGNSVAEIGAQFDPGVDWDDLAWIRSIWPGKLLVKGPLSPTDAARAVDAGADGVHLSVHGGRQLDRALPPADFTTAVRQAVGPDATVLVDSGIRHGADVVTALALGADAAFIGRPYLWGLAAGGQAGVVRVLELLRAETKRTMQLLGVTSVAELRESGTELLARASTNWGTPLRDTLRRSSVQ
ncbi:alpha-hydroxy acid oxidase [Brachybacterium sp. AOP42-C2-15]|uniref:alpha-hydroxy acid oxidase n=1 Tax=Brachybacterium sp. AOP42-C2-15 TaxID=3457670 RepID=UPI003FD92779